MDARNSRQRCLLVRPTTVFVLAGWLMFAGCGGKKGIPRYDLSGQIKFDGKIVPSGYLQFIPDRKRGNRGPGSSATIKEGHYETMPDMGTVGGPHIVKITGTDGVPYKTKTGDLIPIGRRLFPEIDVDVDLPKESGSTHNFDLTAEQVKKR